jgi:hypothetical protein
MRVNCASRRCVDAQPRLFDDAVKIVSAQIERHRRQKHSIGKLRHPFHRAADPDDPLHAIVIRLHVRIIHCPIHAVAVARGSFELVIRHAIGGARPVHGAPAQASRPRPPVIGVRRSRVRILRTVQHDAVVPLGTRVAPHRAGLSLPAKLHFVQKPVMKILRRNDLRPCFQHQHLHAGAGKLHRRPTAAGARPNHDGVVDFHISWCCG